jgi:hypothetical protein
VVAALGDRIYPQQIQQGAEFPAASYQITGRRQVVALSGPVDHYEAALKIDVAGATYGSAKSTAAVVDDAIKGHVGVVGSLGNQLRIRGILAPAASDEIEPPQHGAEGGIHKVALEYRAIWQQTP